jgi:hypothetical protein
LPDFAGFGVDDQADRAANPHPRLRRPLPREGAGEGFYTTWLVGFQGFQRT